MPGPTPGTEVTVRQASYFAAAATSGSMTAAAERLGVSQAAVSLAVGQLERRLGTRLLHRRRGQPLQLTADGQRALYAARDLMGAAQRLAEVADETAEPRGSISVGWYSPLSPVLLPRVLDVFRQDYPQLELLAREGTGDDLWEGLDTRSLDVVLTYGLMVPERFDVDFVHDVVPMVLLSPDDPLAAQSSVSLRDLADQPAVVFDFAPSRDYLATLLDDVGARPRVAHMSKNLETIRSLVARGEGYTIAVTPMPDARSVDGLPIEVRPLADDVTTTSLVMVRSTPTLGRRAAAFLEACTIVAAEVFAA